MVNKVVKIILAILIPPLGAFLQVEATKHFWINIVLLSNLRYRRADSRPVARANGSKRLSRGSVKTSIWKAATQVAAFL